MEYDSSSIIDTIHAMHRQEAIGYLGGDYLNMYSPDLVAVNVDCRTKMAQWCYSVSTTLAVSCPEYSIAG
jgi:hypothetical protein